MSLKYDFYYSQKLAIWEKYSVKNVLKYLPFWKSIQSKIYTATFSKSQLLGMEEGMVIFSIRAIKMSTGMVIFY